MVANKTQPISGHVIIRQQHMGVQRKPISTFFFFSWFCQTSLHNYKMQNPSGVICNCSHGYMRKKSSKPQQVVAHIDWADIFYRLQSGFLALD